MSKCRRKKRPYREENLKNNIDDPPPLINNAICSYKWTETKTIRMAKLDIL